MIKDYYIVDNFFDNPSEVIELSKTLNYRTASNKEGWPGIRSSGLDIQFFKNFLNKIFDATNLKDVAYNYEIDIHGYFHKIKNNIDQNKDWRHTDPCLLAGVIYLDGEPCKDAGTTLHLQDETVVIDNIFNRLIMYRGDILHNANKCKDSTYVERNTLVFFIHSLTLNLDHASMGE